MIDYPAHDGRDDLPTAHENYDRLQRITSEMPPAVDESVPPDLRSVIALGDELLGSLSALGNDRTIVRAKISVEKALQEVIRHFAMGGTR